MGKLIIMDPRAGHVTKVLDSDSAVEEAQRIVDEARAKGQHVLQEDGQMVTTIDPNATTYILIPMAGG